ncbi:GATA zinc finger domain containing protein [Acanthamoeba castellanii str. Neff]|uniref:GATA zinc finger domain containing protein n=1 Tax=Acanthamoeba castellanii (strain ATCC 30010 / Neff) TaxID=1257118 RepID=L8GS46_ACACF|nr:GATA zinc finger domain containing protein [Acanthamoeba castellanii str. Neff]ELR15815.1 GATA zinc finger domain containing protein [Acanthamoeba castellanii str. Neff]
MEPNPMTSESNPAAEGASMSKVMQSAQNIYLLSRVGTKRGLDQPALKRMLRELCDLESQLTTISPSSSRPSSPVADICSSPSSPASPSTSSSTSPSLSSTSPTASPARSAAAASSAAAKRNIASKNSSSANSDCKNNKKQLRRKAYVCSGCGATESSQWRNGPDGTKRPDLSNNNNNRICNPCGMKFWRLKRKMMKRQSEEMEATASHNHAKASGGVVQLHQLRPQQESQSTAAAAMGLQHLHHLGAAAAAAGQLSTTSSYAPHQQLFRPYHHGYPASFISNQSLHNQNDEEVMAAGMMMQHLRTASFSSITSRSSRPSSTSFSSIMSSSPLSSLSSSSPSLSTSFSSIMSSPSSSPSPSPTPDSAERKRSSIYDLLN